MAILQVQSVASTWREIGRCSNNPTMIAQRLDQLKSRYKDKTVRAIDDKTHMLLDIR